MISNLVSRSEYSAAEVLTNSISDHDCDLADPRYVQVRCEANSRSSKVIYRTFTQDHSMQRYLAAGDEGF